MKIDAKHLYFVLLGTIGLALVVLLLGAYGANAVLKSKSQAVKTARMESLVLEEKQRQLSKARADINKYKSLAEIAKSIVPQDKDQAQTVREIVSIAAAHGIKLGSVTFPASSLGDVKTPHSQLKAVKNIPGVYTLQITVQSDSNSPASYSNFLSFLDALEHNRRTALVDGISLQPQVNNPSKLIFTLTLNEYIKP